MNARTFVLGATLGLVGLLALLTIDVAIREGIDVLVGLSVAILALIGVGAVGALRNPPER